ncbi:MAG: Mu transposase C-terminal domain-containing protein [Candidatus Rokuibacteriota bacterium]
MYRDNGKDFVCKYWGGKARVSRGVSLSGETMALLRPGVLFQDGVRLHTATPFTPWAKPIEPWFGRAFSAWERTLPGWCGRDNKERPEKLADEIGQGLPLTLDEFTQRASARINAYNATPCGALQGASPNEIWDGVVIDRILPATLDLLLMRHKPVTVQAHGIKLFGRRYQHPDLHLYWKQEVVVRYAPQEIGVLHVFDRSTNAKICEATNRAAMQMGAAKEDLQALAREKHAALVRTRQAIRDRRTLFRPEEVLAELAARRRAVKTYTLRREPAPAPGTKPVGRLVPGFDAAAAALSRTSARRTGRQITEKQESRPPVAAPAAAAALERDDRAAMLSELLAAAPRRPDRRADRDAERDAVLNELING